MNQSGLAHQFSLPSTQWTDNFSSGMSGWNFQKGGSGIIVLSNTNYLTAPYSLHLQSPKGTASYAFIYPPANIPKPGSNGVLSQINYTENYVVDFNFYLPTSQNHWIYVFANKHIISVIDQGTTFTTRSNRTNTPVINLNTTTWYHIRYWVEPANQTYHIDIFNYKLNKWVVWEVTRKFHGESWTPTPFLIGDADKSDPTSNYGEAYWDDFRISFTGTPIKVVFRLLAVEGFYGASNSLNESGNSPRKDYPMKSAQYLIETLTQYTNWKNVTHGVYNYVSYIHLLSNATVAPALQKYYRGLPTNSNVVSEIQSFLGRTGNGESNDLTIRIFYYVGHSGRVVAKANGISNASLPLVKYFLALGEYGSHPQGPSSYQELYASQLDKLLQSGDLNSSHCVLVILDSCHSGGLINSLKRSGRVILTACASNQLAWGWLKTPLPGFWSWFTGDPSPIYPTSPFWKGQPLGIRGAIVIGADINGDGWISANDLFQHASWSVPIYALNASSAMNVPPIVMTPQKYYGVRSGEIPLVMVSPWRSQVKPHTYPPQIVFMPTGFPFNALPVLTTVELNFPWSNYRSNSQRTGYSKSEGLKTSTILWEKPLIDSILSSAAISYSLVFITTIGNEAGGSILALDIKTGDTIWSFSVNSSIHSSSVVANGTIFFGTDSGTIYAVDAYRGLITWTCQISTASIVSSPTVVDGIIFIGSTDGRIYALNQTSGAPIWDFPTNGPINSSPAVFNGKVFCGSDDGRIYAINETLGTMIWYFETSSSIVSTPAVVDGMVFVGSTDDILYALDESSGLPIWDFHTGGPILSSPAVDSTKSIVVIGSEDGFVYALSETNGLPLWSFNTGSTIGTSSPAVSSDGLIYIGAANGNIYCINETNGGEIWSFSTGSPIDSSPSLSDEHVFFGSSNGDFYCFGLPFPIHDIVATNLTLSSTIVCSDSLVYINYTVSNYGNVYETFNVTIAYNVTQVWTPPLYNETIPLYTETLTLAPMENLTKTFAWNTTGFTLGNYTISIYVVSCNIYDANTTNNIFVDGIVKVVIPGDVNGDKIVDIFDLVIVASAYGSTPGDANWNPNADINKDNVVDIFDLVIVASHYGQQNP